MIAYRLTTRSLKSLDPTSPRAAAILAAQREAVEAHSLDLPLFAIIPLKIDSGLVV
jgi:hypothetical protein